MSSYVSTKKRSNGKASESKVKQERPRALALKESRARSPVIDLSTITDVSTAACVEMSRQIMRSPEINTGSLFKLTAASGFETNKSDAVIVISAAILDSIGNKKAADKMLRKSGTVMEFYDRMNLNNDQVRDSFCIMLFAIAPEFVKMVEASLKTSLERVQTLTTAEHADNKILQATGELVKDGSISVNEHCKMLDDLAELKISTAGLDSPNSIQFSPEDGISVDDSISRIGKEAKSVIKNTSPLTSRGILRFAKKSKEDAYKNFYKEFPEATRPVMAMPMAAKSGLGFSSSASTIPDDITESNFGDVMDSLMMNNMKRGRQDSMTVNENMFTRPIAFVRASPEESVRFVVENNQSRSSVNAMDFQVTSDDIEEMKTTDQYRNREKSAVITNSGSTADDEFLLSLL